MIIEQWECSVKLAIVFSGIFLWVGMLTGVWKYIQISQSPHAKSHYYVDVAHRSSLLYAPATLILAVLAYCSAWSELVNFICVAINLFFFSFSILSYILHGFLKDTNNQFKQPHQLGRFSIPTLMMRSAMISLVIGELGATCVLLIGTVKTLF